MTQKSGRGLQVAIGLAVVGLFSALGWAQTMGTPEMYQANAVNMNAGAQGPVEIGVEKWSSDAQRDKLMSVLLDRGPDKLLDALQDMPSVGYLRTPGNL